MSTKRIFQFLLAGVTVLPGTIVHAEYVDCRTCHFEVSPDNQAPDFTSYFTAEGHHPVRTAYPSQTDYNQPPFVQAEILYFDLDGDGQPGTGDVQIYRTTLGEVIDCASCHMEHGILPPDPTHPVSYLRATQPGQSLCVTCHRL